MRSMHLIRDERLPSMPANPVPLFVKDRYASGDFKGVASGEAMKLIHAEFQALPAAEKKVSNMKYRRCSTLCILSVVGLYRSFARGQAAICS
jgi:hypothetical protein